LTDDQGWGDIEGRWKLILGTLGSGGHSRVRNLSGWDRISQIDVGQLYDLEVDPYEQINVFDKHPEIVKRLAGRLEEIYHEGRSRP